MSLIDIHTHLLPGVDDSKLGKFSFKKMMRAYADAGIDAICFSPHINDPYVDTKIDRIEKTFDWAREKAEKEGLKVFLGCELYIRDDAKPERIYPHFGEYVLCETAVDFAPRGYLDSLRKLRDDGKKIIIAHIERYNWLSPESDTFRILKEELGCLIQINAKSADSTKAQSYLRKDAVDFIASDNHGKFDYPALLMEKIVSNPRVYQKMSRFAQNIS
ncbi:MAG: CpsB/CapC family capsule biosynthesis tyrosine phosphatase [Bullifex sp.]